ncbi:hypothetical protein J3R30DRAFT_3286648, partial [Lentinula aciculospora]
GSLPTRHWFDKHLFSVLSSDYGGHSVRARSATFFASLRVSESVTQAMGHWSSDVWKIYVHDHPTVRAELQLASLHASLNCGI